MAMPTLAELSGSDVASVALIIPVLDGLALLETVALCFESTVLAVLDVVLSGALVVKTLSITCIVNTGSSSNSHAARHFAMSHRFVRFLP
jgi:hypothetical protein